MDIINLAIQENVESFTVTLNLSVGHYVTNIYVWTEDTFVLNNGELVPSEAIDIDISGYTITDGVPFTISIADINETKAEGIYYFQFVSTDDVDTEDILGITANFAPFYECLVNKSLILEVVNCEELSYGDCPECENNAPYTSTLIEALNAAITLNYLEEAAKIVQNLNSLCKDCSSCPDYSEVDIVPNTGYATVNNSYIANS